MHGPFIPPEPEKGDPNTIGGYAAVHGRPAAFEGADGLSYSVEIVTDTTGEKGKPYGAYFLFLRWNETADPVVTGHIETDFLEGASSAAGAAEKIGGMKLADVKKLLDALIEERRSIGGPPVNKPTRPWWETMQEEDEG